MSDDPDRDRENARFEQDRENARFEQNRWEDRKYDQKKDEEQAERQRIIDRLSIGGSVPDRQIKRELDKTEKFQADLIEEAKALYNKGVTLDALKCREEALVVYDEVVKRFGMVAAPTPQEQLAKALENQGARLDALTFSEPSEKTRWRNVFREARRLAVYRKMVKRFGMVAAPALQELVAKALYNAGTTLDALKRREEALAAYDEVVERFGTADEPALQEQVEKALYNAGTTLNALNRREEALAAYDEVVERFGTADEPALQEQVEKARLGRLTARLFGSRSLDKGGTSAAAIERGSAGAKKQPRSGGAKKRH